MLEGQKILVAGGTGFLGHHLVNRLVDDGARVRATHFSRSPRAGVGRVEHMHADLTRAEDCQRAVQGMDAVFMCAAVTSGAAVMAANPLAHITPNVVMNALMLEAAYRAKVKRFVFISSSAAYPPTGDRPVREEEMFDGDPYDVYYGVGWMKRYGEVLCRMYAQKIKNPMATVVVRPSNVYGPADKFEFATSHVTAALLRRVVERHRPLEVWGTGDDVRDLIYIADFLDGLLLAYEKAGDFLEINLANGKGHSVKEVLQTLLEVDGFADADVRFDPTKPRTIPIRLVDASRAKQMLGFHAKTDLKEGLRRTVEWYRDNLLARPAGVGRL